jgi:hypothetical protein
MKKIKLSEVKSIVIHDVYIIYLNEKRWNGNNKFLLCETVEIDEEYVYYKLAKREVK